MMRAPRHAALAIAIAALSCGSRAALADGAEPSESTVEEARANLKEGTAKLYAGNPAEALSLLVRSYALVPSPNTELLLGRAERELGRRVDAASTLEHAAREAKRRVDSGESKYAPTANAARDEAAALRAQLGTLELHVASPRSSTLSVDGKPVTLEGNGTVVLLHEPGRAEIVVHEGTVDQRQAVTVLAGSTLRIDFTSGGAQPVTVASNRPAGPPVAPPSTSTHWTTPAAWTAGAVTVVGIGAFAFFGLRGRAAYDDLSTRCGPSNCGPADRADADSGKREELVANVALGVAVVAAVSLVTFLLVAPGSSPQRAASVFRPALGPAL